MLSSQVFDYIVIGGGIAGSTFSNLMGQKGYKVLVIEKDDYPKHKVCGEYVSMESYDFMKGLGVPLDSFDLPRINQFQLSKPTGRTIDLPLELGGFGISRYLMDSELKRASLNAGSQWIKDTVISYVKDKNLYEIKTKNNIYLSKEIIGAWGKRSLLDNTLERPFYSNKKSRLTNWVGIKYHVKSQLLKKDLISLHTFKNGYCGMSKIEKDTFCICYLMRGENLRNRTIQESEELFLYKNPYIKDVFTQSEFVFDQPLAISQISFQNKSKNDKHTLMLGDAAGLIAPLCGNGMSMAMHSALLASRIKNKTQYPIQWKKEFNQRIKLGRFVQYIFGRTVVMSIFIQLAHHFPFIAKWMIRKSHGRPF
jgi:flavin-dependent dehydrogenase